MFLRIWTVFRWLFIWSVGAWIAAPANAQVLSPDLSAVQLPEGFTISVYAEGLDNARSLAVGDAGTVFVGTRTHSYVYALADADADGVAEQTYRIGSGLVVPNGVAFHDGALYVAEQYRIIRYDDIEANLAAPPVPVVITQNIPRDDHHGWKYLRIGPDERLYVTVGVPCNICELDPPYGTILSMTLEGEDIQVMAEGIRNSVGFDWHPETGDLWFTDNGRDWVTDDLPPDELNHVSETGQHFGFPYCHGSDFPDPAFGTDESCATYRAPVQDLGPHVAALGMRFYDGEMFPESYRNHVLIAEHGSWNRVESRIGYRVMMVTLDGNTATDYVPFAEGWLDATTDLFVGRPVDVLVMPDGALLISDDHADAVYRVSYSD